MQFQCPKGGAESRGTQKTHAERAGGDRVEDGHSEARQRRMNSAFFQFLHFSLLDRQKHGSSGQEVTPHSTDSQLTNWWLAQSGAQLALRSHFVPSDLPLQGWSSSTLGRASSLLLLAEQRLEE